MGKRPLAPIDNAREGAFFGFSPSKRAIMIAIDAPLKARAISPSFLPALAVAPTIPANQALTAPQSGRNPIPPAAFLVIRPPPLSPFAKMAAARARPLRRPRLGGFRQNRSSPQALLLVRRVEAAAIDGPRCPPAPGEPAWPSPSWPRRKLPKRALQFGAKVTRLAGKLFARRSLIGGRRTRFRVAGYVVNGAAVSERNPQAVRDAVPVLIDGLEPDRPLGPVARDDRSEPLRTVASPSKRLAPSRRRAVPCLCHCPSCRRPSGRA
jgi:hypothetical protein